MVIDRVLRKLAFLITIGMLLKLPWRLTGADGETLYTYVWVFDYLLKPGEAHWEKLVFQICVTWSLAFFIPTGLRWFDKRER